MRKLIKDTKRLVRWRLFLNEAGISKYQLSSGKLREILKAVSRRKNS